MNAMPLTVAAPTFAPRRAERDWTSYAVVGVIALLVGLAVGALMQSRQAPASATAATATAALPRAASLTPEAHLYGSRSVGAAAVAVPVAAAPAPLVREEHFVSGQLRARAAAARTAASTVPAGVARSARETHFYGA